MKKNKLIKLLLSVFLPLFITIIILIPPLVIDKKFVNRLSKIQHISYYDQEKTVAFADILSKQNKYFIVHFFATWCRFCHDDHFVLLDLKDKIDIYGFALRDNEISLNNYFNMYGNPYKDIMIDYNGILIKNFLSIHSVPTTYLIGQDGKVIYSYKGGINERRYKKITSYISMNTLQ